MKELSTLLIALTVSVCSVYSQTKTIKGRVLSEHLDVLTGTSIMINDTVEVGRADMNGFFQIDIPISEKRITFRFLGVEPTTIELVDECDKIEVILMLSSTYDFISPRRAERKRKKRFKKLPEIHKQAFEKGMFETEQPCYKRWFEPFYIQKN